MKQDEELPEHDLGWVTGVDGLSPEAEIMDALRVSPEIWMKLLPEGVCIVSRERLAQLAQGIPWSTDLLELEGVATVEHYAAKRLNEIEALERDKRRGLQR